MNTYDAEQFERMFKNSGLNCLAEINTMKAIFPPSMVICTHKYTCATDKIKCFEHSTMFDGTTPVSPLASEITKIIYRHHFIGAISC